MQHPAVVFNYNIYAYIFFFMAGHPLLFTQSSLQPYNNPSTHANATHHNNITNLTVVVFTHTPTHRKRLLLYFYFYYYHHVVVSRSIILSLYSLQSYITHTHTHTHSHNNIELYYTTIIIDLLN